MLFLHFLFRLFKISQQINIGALQSSLLFLYHLRFFFLLSLIFNSSGWCVADADMAVAGVIFIFLLSFGFVLYGYHFQWTVRCSMDLGPICLISYSASWYLEDSVNGSSKTVQSKFSTHLPLKVPKQKN